jgi:hypothetical protein
MAEFALLQLARLQASLFSAWAGIEAAHDCDILASRPLAQAGGGQLGAAAEKSQ